MSESHDAETFERCQKAAGMTVAVKRSHMRDNAMSSLWLPDGHNLVTRVEAVPEHGHFVGELRIARAPRHPQLYQCSQ